MARSAKTLEEELAGFNSRAKKATDSGSLVIQDGYPKGHRITREEALRDKAKHDRAHLYKPIIAGNSTENQSTKSGFTDICDVAASIPWNGKDPGKHDAVSGWLASNPGVNMEEQKTAKDQACALEIMRKLGDPSRLKTNLEIAADDPQSTFLGRMEQNLAADLEKGENKVISLGASLENKLLKAGRNVVSSVEDEAKKLLPWLLGGLVVFVFVMREI
jgi:hypothetical protein